MPVEKKSVVKPAAEPAKVEVKAEAAKPEAAKETVKKAAAPKKATTVKKAAAPKKAASTVKKTAAPKKAAEPKKAAAPAAKKAEDKVSVTVQYSGKSYSQAELLNKAREAGIKLGKNVDLYVKTEENRVYVVADGKPAGDFEI